MAGQWHRLYYDDWVAREGLELIRGHKVENVYTQPLRPWARTGGYAVHIQLDGTGEQNAAYICEIPPTQELRPQRHLYEELVYVLTGSGSSTVWYEGRPKRTFEWHAGSLFAIPLNAWHQHFNVSSTAPVRYLAVTTAPIMMNLIRNDDFIFNNDFIFPERYNSEEDYFSGKIREEIFGEWGYDTAIHFSNYWPDINTIEVKDGAGSRGVGTAVYSFELANGVLGAHMLQVPGGTFTKLHRHGPGAHVLWLQGEGYSILWPDGGQKIKEDWGPGTLIVPPNWWWHQHCVVSKEPARHLALKLSSRKNMVSRTHAATGLSTRQGGNQMDYEDMPPEVLNELKGIFIAECTKRGTPMHMEAIVGM